MKAQGCSNSSDVDNLLGNYREIVASYSKRLNLVARRDVENLLETLVLESLLPLSWNACRLESPMIDIGSGAGIPGIPLRIANPGLFVVLLDSNRRKTLFLRRAVEMLRLDGIVVVNQRAEQISQDPQYQGHFGTLVSRATAPVADLLRWGAELLKPGGEAIFWKGSSVVEEQAGLDATGWEGPDLWKHEGGLTLVRWVKAEASVDHN